MPKAVIMAGGPGERFWPLTHKKFPKYRLKLDNHQSLLQKTYERLLRLYPRKNVYVVTTREHVKLIRRELPGLARSHILVEPMRRNTAAAIYLACRALERKFGDREIVSFFPADHLIRNTASFGKTIRNAIHAAGDRNELVTIGIKPTFAATGYGYIEIGKRIQKKHPVYRVKRFVEKPKREKAARYLGSGRFLWNGGIFTWRIGVFLRSMDRTAPEFKKYLVWNQMEKSYRRLPKASIDCALLEKTRNLSVVKTSMDWCDMGSWDMFHEKSGRDKRNNLVHGLCHHDRVRGSLVVNQHDAPLIALGISDLIVVQTKQGTLICKKGFSEEAALLSRRLLSR